LYRYAAPATEAVITSEGSTSAAPVTNPGPRRRTLANRRVQPLAGAGSEGCGTGKSTIFPRSATVPLRDLRELTIQVSFDLALVPESQRLGVSNDSESRDCS
jgi:hypothetical protein